jgi:hypothetical protein
MMFFEVPEFTFIDKKSKRTMPDLGARSLNMPYASSRPIYDSPAQVLGAAAPVLLFGVEKESFIEKAHLPNSLHSHKHERPLDDIDILDLISLRNPGIANGSAMG